MSQKASQKKWVQALKKISKKKHTRKNDSPQKKLLLKKDKSY